MESRPHLPLLALGAVGYNALHHFGNANGFFDLINASVTNGVYTPQFTSVKLLNDLANFFLAFFWPTVDGDHPGLSLACYVFHWLAGWTLIMVEGYRAGNQGRAVACVSIFGLLYQSLGLALCALFYFLAHSLTSPTATMPTMQNIAIPKPALTSLIPAPVHGMILPTLSMSLPTPAYLPHHTKANLVLLWQFFPVWTSLFCPVFVQIFRSFQLPFRPSQILRATYISVITLSALTHASALTLVVTPMLAPSIFNPIHAKQLTGAYLEFPPWPIQSTVKASSIAEGALWFIQYDYIITSWAFLFWSVSLKLASVGRESDPSVWQTVLHFASALVRTAILGPMGCAASLVWERDEAILGSAEPSQDTIEVKKTL